MGTTFQVLGPVRIMPSGCWLREHSAKVRVVLATLLLQANEFVPAGRLHQALWGDDERFRCRSAVPTYVMRLRRLLSTAGLDAVCAIETHPGGYVLNVAPDAFDLTLFQQLTRAAADAGDRGDLDTERDRLSRALDLWQGTPLSNVDSDFLQRCEVPRLVEHWVRARERSFDLHLALRCTADLIPELRRATARFPRHERFWAQLMEALRRAGRPAEAMDAYHAVRRSLAADLGIDPGPTLQRLYLDLLSGADQPGRAVAPDTVQPAQRRPEMPDAVPQPVPEAVAGPVPETAGCRLPHDIADLVGRDELVSRVVAQLSGPDRPGVSPIVVVCGGPGVGKTALAVRAGYLLADRFGGGQLFAALREPDGAPRTPSDVLGGLLRDLGWEDGRIPRDLPGRLTSFRSALAGTRVLLVLDDADDIAQVQPLLPGTPGCAVLITSQSSMLGLTALYGARSLRLPALTEAQSVELVSGLLGDARVAAEESATRELTRLCDFLPLALRIATAQLAGQPDRSIGDYAAALAGSEPLDELRIGRTSGISVRCAIDRSYHRLSADTGRMFRLLGLLDDDTVTVGAAAAVAGLADAEARILLDELVAVSLLLAVGHARYRLPYLLGRYAREKAAAAPTEETAAATRRLLDYDRADRA
jgi:DNA-binding SARP family transcriptional activator